MNSNLKLVFLLILIFSCSPNASAVENAPSAPIKKQKRKRILKKVKTALLVNVKDPSSVERMAIYSLLFAILGFLFPPFAFIALLAGLIALRKMRQNGTRGGVLAIIGIGVGAIAYLIYLGFIVFLLFNLSNL